MASFIVLTDTLNKNPIIIMINQVLSMSLTTKGSVVLFRDGYTQHVKETIDEIEKLLSGININL